LFPLIPDNQHKLYLGVSVAFVMLFYINKKLMYQYHKAVSCQHTRCYFKIISAITTPQLSVYETDCTTVTGAYFQKQAKADKFIVRFGLFIAYFICFFQFLYFV